MMLTGHQFAAEQALKLVLAQEKLERAGWRFDTQWLIGAEKWDVWAWHSVTYAGAHFTRTERSDALAHALQYAELEGSVIETPQTIPAPPPTEVDTMPAPDSWREEAGCA